jgi:hypothetical protein
MNNSNPKPRKGIIMLVMEEAEEDLLSAEP